MSTWTEQWGAYFKAIPNPHVWETEIAARFGTPDTGEVSRAVLELAEQQRKGQLKYAPTLGHLVTAIIKGRYDKRRDSQDGLTADACAMCHKGWVTYTDKRGSDWETPCACNLGKKIAEKWYEEDDMDMLMDQARDGVRQEAERKKKVSAWIQGWTDAGKPTVEQIVETVQQQERIVT